MEAGPNHAVAIDEPLTEAGFMLPVSATRNSNQAARRRQTPGCQAGPLQPALLRVSTLTVSPPNPSRPGPVTVPDFTSSWHSGQAGNLPGSLGAD